MNKAFLFWLLTSLAMVVAMNSCTKEHPTEPDENLAIEWQRTYGIENFNKAFVVRETMDGGYIAGGLTSDQSLDWGEAYLVKVDSMGSLEWQRTYEGGRIMSLEQTIDGGFIAIGSSEQDVWIIKTDMYGHQMWSKVVGGTSIDDGYSIKPTDDGGYIAVGTTSSYGPGFSNIYLIRLNAQGDTLWTKAHGGDGGDMGYSVCVTADSGFAISGATGWSYICLLKTDHQGDTVYVSQTDSTLRGYGEGLTQTHDGGYVISGYASSLSSDYDCFFLRADVNGNWLWHQTIGGERDDRAYDVVQTLDRGYLCAGYTCSFGKGYVSAYLIKADAQGGVDWTDYVGGTGRDYAYSVTQTSDGGYIVSGSTGSFGEYSYDLWLIKIAP